MTSKDLFKEDSEFIKESLINSNNRGRPEKWYNLDAIISIGYRINSKKATQFRIWVRGILKQYMRKGFAINTELLKMVENSLINILMNYSKLFVKYVLLREKSMKK